MEIEFAGAAREVTGSCHLVWLGGKAVALDCGLFQGRRLESDKKNRRLPISIDKLAAVVVSHAHIDHIGRLPMLTRAGYANPIWSTPATRDLAAVMLADAAKIQESDAKHLTKRNRQVVEPLYSMADAATVAQLGASVSYGMTARVTPDVETSFVEAGHILGSASVVLTCQDGPHQRRVVFSGDIGRRGLPIIRDPVPPEDADVVIMESTYGNRLHEAVADAKAHLGRVIRETAERGGKVFIPAFAVGRTQEIVYDLHVLVRERQIPALPIYIDSPLATHITSVFQMHPDCFDDSEALIQEVQELFKFGLLHYTRSVEESKALNTMRGPMVVIAASGMVESGRILHHLVHGASEPRNTILIVGFQGEHTLGRRIVERQPSLRIFGDEVPLRAIVEVLNGYSAHADCNELLDWLRRVKATSPRLETVILVHGEHEAQRAFAELVSREGLRVHIPALGDRIPL